jgi:hypothetical protein
VQQNEVIGYVGQSGLATAPHLDYRVQHGGQWMNPLSLKTVPAAALSDREMASFVRWREQLRDALAEGVMPTSVPGAPTQLARATERSDAQTAVGGR